MSYNNQCGSCGQDTENHIGHGLYQCDECNAKKDAKMAEIRARNKKMKNK